MDIILCIPIEGSIETHADKQSHEYGTRAHPHVCGLESKSMYTKAIKSANVLTATARLESSGNKSNLLTSNRSSFNDNNVQGK